MLSKIFKAYDVRGVYKEELTEDIAFKIGKAFVSFLKCKDVIVGYDMRLSSPLLVKAFSEGVADSGANIIDIGNVCTDAVYFASGSLDKPAVMFTASHNPPQYNGLKFCKAGAIPINQDTGLKRMKEIIEKNRYKKISLKRKNFGRVIKKDILKNYIKHVRSFINIRKLKPLKIAVDAGNGMSGKIIPLLYDGLPVEIIPLYFELDGSFPNHPADPSKSENLKALQKKVLESKCDFGIAFDGDADRIFFVDEDGNAVNSSLISALIIKQILNRKKSAKGFFSKKVIYNLVCSRIVPDTIKKYNGTPIMERVGHSFIKETMRKTKSIFACEHSAHYYYRDNYRADSGMITSLIIAEIVSKYNRTLSQLLSEFKKYFTIEETSIKVDDKNKKLKHLEAVFKKQKPKKILKMDGLTIEFDEWWFNVRASNTEPLLRLNLEANSEELMIKKREELVKMISA